MKADNLRDSAAAGSFTAHLESIEKFFNFWLKYNSVAGIDAERVNKANAKRREQSFGLGGALVLMS